MGDLETRESPLRENEVSVIAAGPIAPGKDVESHYFVVSCLPHTSAMEKLFRAGDRPF